MHIDVELRTLLEEILEQTRNAYAGFNWLSPKDQILELKSVMHFNLASDDLLKNYGLCLSNENYSRADWHDRAKEFIYREFVSDALPQDYTKGKTKRSLLEVLIHGENDPLESELMKQHLEPLLGVFEKYNDLQYSASKIRNSCLIVTALPLEFRAIVRRFSVLTSVTSDEHTNSNVLHKMNFPRLEFDPFIWSLRKDLDKMTDVDIGKSKLHVYERPYWLRAEGLIQKNGKTSKATVMLLPIEGPFRAKDCVLRANRIPYKEILVCGVAATIDKFNDLRIGDLAISENIYGSWIDKLVTLKTLEINNTERVMRNLLSFNCEGWQPELLEKVPEKHPKKGFRKAVPCDFVSLPHLSKAPWVKTCLNDLFPECKGLEMEALGCCDAMGAKKVRIIKSICDKGDHRKNKIWQPYCADVAASFTVDYISETYGTNYNNT